MVEITNRFMISSEKFIRNKFGLKVWDQVFNAFENETRIFYGRKINPKKNVEFARVADVIKTVESVLVKDNPRVLFDLGYHNSEDDLSVTQRLLMKMISVEWVLKAAALLWGQRVKKGGKLSIKPLGRGHVQATVNGFEQPMEQWWKYLEGWFTCAITFSGGKNVKVNWQGNGVSTTEPADYDAIWD